jgi:hypothetical protein
LVAALVGFFVVVTLGLGLLGVAFCLRWSTTVGASAGAGEGVAACGVVLDGAGGGVGVVEVFAG